MVVVMNLKKVIVGIIGIGVLLAVMSVATYAETQSKKDRIELIEKRTAYTKTYRNDDGTDTVTFSSSPIHYLNEAGKWAEIDPALEDSTVETNEDGELLAYKSEKNVFKTYFPKKGNGWVRLRQGKSSLEFKLITNTNSIHLDFKKQNKNGLLAQEIFKNCDLSYLVKNGMLKEDLILKNSSAPASYEYLLRLRNLNLSKNDNGECVFNDKSGKELLAMSKFIMYDAKGESSEDIDVQVKKTGNLYRLIVTPSKTWLSSAERIYPVTVDPTYSFRMQKQKGNCTYYFYLPCNNSQTSFIENSVVHDTTLYINNVDNMKGQIKSYDTKAWYVITETNSVWICHNRWFKVWVVQPADGLCNWNANYK